MILVSGSSIPAGKFLLTRSIESDSLIRDVLYPGGNQHSLDSMCNRPYDQCTKEAFMRYLGVDNPQVPFPIYISFSNDTSESQSYYNQTTFLCSEPLVTQYENKSACGCLVSCLRRFSFQTNRTFRIVSNRVCRCHRIHRRRNFSLRISTAFYSSSWSHLACCSRVSFSLCSSSRVERKAKS